MLYYLSYLFRLQLLSKDFYLLEALQSADKTKTHPKAKLQNAPTFTGNGSHSHVCLFLVIKIKHVPTNCLNDNQGSYQRTNQPLPIIGKMVDNPPIPIIGASLVIINDMASASVSPLAHCQQLIIPPANPISSASYHIIFIITNCNQVSTQLTAVYHLTTVVHAMQYRCT